MFVYNPCEKLDAFVHASSAYSLPVQSVTELGREAAECAVRTLGKFGVCFVSGEHDAAGKATADAVWKAATREWAEELQLQYEKRAKPRREAGLLPPDPRGEEAEAIAWLKRNKLVP